MTLVVDGNSVFARAYYAASATEGQFRLTDAFRRYYLNSVFGIMHAVGRPTRHLYCWDGKWAKTVKPRNDKPDSYYVLRDVTIETTAAIFGPSACIQLDDHESDDLVATVALREANQHGDQADVVVVSGDKDLTQLVGPGVRYWCLNKKRLMPAAEIAERWGVHRPSQVAIALAIIGDKGDGINGVRGMGRKAVEKLFQAIPRDASLMDSLNQVDEMLKPHQREEFHDSFQYTLLDITLDGVPDPAAFHLTPPESIDADWREDYEQMVCIDDPEAMERHLSRLEDAVSRLPEIDAPDVRA